MREVKPSHKSSYITLNVTEQAYPQKEENSQSVLILPHVFILENVIAGILSPSNAP